MRSSSPGLCNSMAEEHKVLVTCPPFLQVIDAYRKQCEERGVSLVTPTVEQELSEDALVALVGDVDGIVAGDDPFTERVIAAAPKLKVFVKWGIGIDAIDVAALERRGIAFSNTPGVFGDEVADVAMGYIIMLARQLHVIDREVRDGRWVKPPGVTLRGKVIGIIGFGTVGQALASRAQPFGLTVSACDVEEALSNKAQELGVRWGGLEDVLAEADFVVLCCNLTDENRHLMNSDRITVMKKGSYLVNVSRGPLVDEEALIEALTENHLAGAALDVFENEPLASGHALRAFPQCIFGSHNASNTSEAVHRVSRLALDKMFSGLDGGSVA